MGSNHSQDSNRTIRTVGSCPATWPPVRASTRLTKATEPRTSEDGSGTASAAKVVKGRVRAGVVSPRSPVVSTPAKPRLVRRVGESQWPMDRLGRPVQRSVRSVSLNAGEHQAVARGWVKWIQRRERAVGHGFIVDPVDSSRTCVVPTLVL